MAFHGIGKSCLTPHRGEKDRSKVHSTVNQQGDFIITNSQDGGSLEGACFLKRLLLLATEFEFVCVVIHASGISIHFLAAVLVEISQPTNTFIVRFSAD